MTGADNVAGGISDAELITICEQLFPTPRELMVLAHVALHFCHVTKSSLNTHQLAKAINGRFPALTPAHEVKDYTLWRFITRSTIHPGHDPNAPDVEQTVAKLGAYIISQFLADRSLRDKPVISEAFEHWDFLAEAERKFKTHATRDNPRIMQDRYFVGTMRSLSNIPATDGAVNVYRDFFGDVELRREAAVDYRDICYFLNYRYGAALEKIRMIRTFISISTPAYNDYGVFEYRHLHVHSEMKAGISTRKLRKSRGILQQVGENYYFLGGSARQNNLGRFPVNAEGIQVIVVSQEEFKLGTSGLVALFLTNDNAMHPMIGRSALIPLGTMSGLGRKIRPEEFSLGVFEPNQLKDIVDRDLGIVNKADSEKAKIIEFINSVVNLDHAELDKLDKELLCDFIRLPIRADLPKKVDSP
jgi:hypothetical protein